MLLVDTDSSAANADSSSIPPVRAVVSQLGKSLLHSMGTTRGLLTLLALGAALRLVIAPHLGFYGDLRYFVEWATRLDEVGLAGFYSPDIFSDYPPGYLYVLALLAQIDPTPGFLLLKLPILAADLAVAWLAGSIAVRITPPRLATTVPVRAVVMLAVVLGPAVLGVGMLWGQVDIVPLVFVLAGVLLLIRSATSVWFDAAALLSFSAAFAIKPQSTFLAPVVLYVLVQRYVLSGKGRRAHIRGVATIASVVAPGAVLWAISGLPFGLNTLELLRFYQASAEVLPVTSANAFNFWGMFAFFRGDSAPSSGVAEFSVFWLSSQLVGVLLFVAGTSWCIYTLHRSMRRGGNLAANFLWAAAALSMLAYTFLTRMHERYALAAIVLTVPLVALPKFRRWYIAVSLYFVANLWYPFTFFNSQWRGSDASLGVRDLRFEPWFSWLFGDLTATDSPQRRVLSGVGVALCLILVVRGPRWVNDAEVGHFDTPGALTERLRTALRRHLTHGLTPQQPLLGSSTLRRRATLAGLGLIVVWWLGSLRDQLRAARTLNDSTFHMQMVRWAEEQLRDGRIPFDGWFPDLTLGSAFFHYYQSLPYNLTALFSLVMPGDTDQTFRWSLYILLATWPLIIYASARLLQLSRATAMIAASVSLLLVSVTGYGFEIGSYTFGGYGVYTQLFGMWMLPLAWAATWRALHQNGSLALAAIAVAFTVATHFMTGYLALVSVAAIALAAPNRTVLMRGGAVLVGAPLVASWVLVPLLRDRHFATVSEFYIGTIFNDSYGAGSIVRWLVSGSLLDEGRLPIITLLAAIGVAACAVQWRVNVLGRALLLLAAASLALFFGRATWGSLTNLLPGDDNLQMHRFVAGVHLSAIFLAAIGGNVVLRTVVAAAHKVANSVAKNRGEQVNSTAWLSPTVAVAVLGLLLTPALIERTNYSLRDGDYIDAQQAQDAVDGADVNALLDVVAERNDGRVYAGTRANWGKDYLIGSVPVLQMLAHRDLDSLGYTFRTMPSLSNDIEAYIDETNLAQLEMFNVRYLVLPADRAPQVSATLLLSRGRHRLYEVTTSGYLDVVDRVGSIAADRSNLAARTGEFRTSQNALAGVYPGIAFDGRDASANTFDGTPPQRPGTVVSQSHQRRSGAFTAKVSLQRPGVVLAKTTYDPGWRAFVEGVERPTIFMAPAFVGVDVGIGTHDVRFEYQPYSKYPLWWALGVATLAALSWLHRRLATKVRS